MPWTNARCGAAAAAWLALAACGGPPAAPAAGPPTGTTATPTTPDTIPTTGTDCPTLSDFYADADADGYGDPATAEPACEAAFGRVSNAGDCDDAEPLAWTGAPEVACDGADNDCDGVLPQCRRGFADATAILAGPTPDVGLGGYVTSFVGDVDGDGTSDAVLGPWRGAADAPTEAWLVHGPSLAVSGPVVPDAALSPGVGDWRIGAMPAGDGDGDGLGDFWFAWPLRLVLGKDLGPTVDLTTVATTVLVPIDTPQLWGSAADATGDGAADLLVSTGEDMLLYHGPYPVGTFEGDHPNLTIHLTDYNDGYGTAGVADLDGDGAADLLVGINGDDGFGQSPPLVNIAVVPGDLTGTVDFEDAAPFTAWLRSPDWWRAIPAGDVNGDGYDDLVASRWTTWHVIPGPVAGELTEADALLSFDMTSLGSPKLLLAMGDLDGDGFDDLASVGQGVPDPYVKQDFPDGELDVVRGGRSGALDPTTADAVWTGIGLDAGGAPLGSLGDATGDGVNDLLLSMEQIDTKGEHFPSVVYFFDGALLLDQVP